MKRLASSLLTLLLALCLFFPALAEETPIQQHMGKLQSYFPSLHLRANSRGDCSLIVFPSGETMLIDTGMPVASAAMIAYLKELGVEKIDYFVNSHYHDDHLGGAYAIFLAFPVERVLSAMWSREFGLTYQSSSLADVLRAFDIPEEMLRAGDTLDVGDVHIDVLWPLPDSDLSVNDQMMDPDFAGKQNDYALVFRLSYGEFSALFTGDVEYESQTELANLYGVDGLESTLLKSPHHGNQLGEDFMDCVYSYATFVTNDYEPWEQVAKVLKVYSMHSYFYSLNEGLSLWTDGTVVNFQAEAGDTELYTYDLTEE